MTSEPCLFSASAGASSCGPAGTSDCTASGATCSNVRNAPADWPAWYRLAFDYRIRLADKLALLKHFGAAGPVFAASVQERAQIIGHSAAAVIDQPEDSLAAAIEANAAWLAACEHHHLVPLGDALYPQRLLDLSDPPLLMYVNGNPACLNLPGLAVVGSRSATPQGVENARAFAKCVARAGYCVVSGLALGIDAAAHDGAMMTLTPPAPAARAAPATPSARSSALAAPDLPAARPEPLPALTLALIGTGIDRVYPAAHRNLARRIAQCGAIVSELPLGTPPLPHHFPRRNRLIAALSEGVLVVEAARQSGSLITAALAAEMGREVFAIPGSIHSPVAKGCHHLIRQGAKLVESGEDILEELRPLQARLSLNSEAAAKSGEGHGRDHADDPVLAALAFEPVLLSELLKRCTLPSGLLQKRLLELELEGRVARLDDGRLLQIVEAS